MPRRSMYSPDISQLSPRLYRLGKHFGVPMTQLADRLICFLLQHLEQAMPDNAVPVVGLEPVVPSAADPTLRDLATAHRLQSRFSGSTQRDRRSLARVLTAVSQPRDLAGETDLSGRPDYF